MLPTGTLPVAAGLAVSGLTAYGFLAIASRALGPKAYAPLSVLWTLVFLAAPGLFLPLEQEVSRAISARRAQGLGGRPVVVRAAVVGSVVAVLVSLAAALAHGPLVASLFDGETLLLVGFVVSLLLYLAYYVVRGLLSGSGAFGAYGLLLGVEGVARVLACAALATLGVRVIGLYGLDVGLPCLAGVVLALALRRGLLRPGPPARWTEISHAVGYLVAGSVLGQFLVNVGPVAVKVLALRSETAAPGTFLNGVVIARIPLFFFQAVQAALLPALAALAVTGQLVELRHRLARLLTWVALVGAISIAANAVVGPYVVSRFFGSGFVLRHLDMALLAAASSVYMLAVALVQAVIALSGHRLVPIGWAIGVLCFFVSAAVAPVIAADLDVVLRVEIALVAGSIAALAAMTVLLLRQFAAVGERGLRSPGPGGAPGRPDLPATPPRKSAP